MSDLLNSNPCHNPAGSTGGQFCPSSGSGGAGVGSTVGGNISGEQALSEYQDQGYSTINSNLRSGKKDAVIDQKVEAIDSLFSKENVRDVYLIRGDGAGMSTQLFAHTGITKEMQDAKLSLDNHDSFFDKKPPSGTSWDNYLTSKLSGQVFEDKAFISTSKSESVVNKKFVDWGGISPHGGQGIVHISGKSKSLDVDSITGVKAGESEHLLPRGTKFKVNRVSVLLGQREGYTGTRGEGFRLRWDVEIII
jgi:hypothetical protein